MLAQVYNNKVPIRHSCSYLESQYLKICIIHRTWLSL